MLPLIAAFLATQPVAWVEAENCEVVCAVQQKVGESMFASGGHIARNYWGQTAGDRIVWQFRTDARLQAPWFAFRYAFDKSAFGRSPDNPRMLAVVVNGTAIGKIHVPDTGGWPQFQVTWLKLPDLRPGRNTIEVRTQAPETNADVDCMGLFLSRYEPAAPFRDTVISRSKDGRFICRRTAYADVTDTDHLFKEFGRIYDEMKSSTGWVPAVPVGINAVEDARWSNPGWTAWTNGFGSFFHASIIDRDYGNWCHELTHSMFCGRCPPWLEEPFVRIITGLVWVDRLYPLPADIAAHRESVLNAGRNFREHPEEKYASIDPVLAALCDQYGADVLVRFLRACSDAAQRKELDFTPDRKLTQAEVIRYFTKAAGEDVTPFFRRWSGYVQSSEPSV